MAIEACDHAQRLSPFDPLDYWNAVSRAIVHLVAGCFEAAIECADRALRDQPRVGIAIRVKIAANAHLGRLDEARADLGRQLAINPKLTIAGYRAFMAPAVAPEVCDLLVTGLRLAGLPEE